MVYFDIPDHQFQEKKTFHNMVLLSSACHLHQTITTLSLIVFSISELCQNTSIVCALGI